MEHLDDKLDDGMTPLQSFTRKHDVQMVRRLIEASADMDLKDTSSYSPLVGCLAYAGSKREEAEAIATMLIEAGADVNSMSSHSQTALHYAAANGHPEICALLVEAKVEVEHKDSLGSETALAIAQRFCTNNKEEVLRILES